MHPSPGHSCSLMPGAAPGLPMGWRWLSAWPCWCPGPSRDENLSGLGTLVAWVHGWGQRCGTVVGGQREFPVITFSMITFFHQHPARSIIISIFSLEATAWLQSNHLPRLHHQ